MVENAKNNLDNIYKLKKIKISRTTEPLEELGQLLDIPYPKVIEIFDNSNIQGVSSVSAMVCYVDGMPSKKDYRKYKIKTVKQADDYHTMQEVINRRYSRLKKENRPMPNLIIVDGGKPQVSAAKIILEKLSLDIPLMGLLKDDNHRTKGIITKDFQEIILNKKSKIFLLMEAMQDEVHRFAITYFKQTHSKTMLTSALDGIEGIGKNRKRVLIENFDNIFDIAHTTPERLKALGIPNALAIKIIETLKNRDQS